MRQNLFMFWEIIQMCISRSILQRYYLNRLFTGNLMLLKSVTFRVRFVILKQLCVRFELELLYFKTCFININFIVNIFTACHTIKWTQKRTALVLIRQIGWKLCYLWNRLLTRIVTDCIQYHVICFVTNG